VNRAMLAEQFLDIILGRCEGQVAHVDLLQSIISKCRLTGLTKRSEPPAFSGKSPALLIGPAIQSLAEP
jgi:hypothetical protein